MIFEKVKLKNEARKSIINSIKEVERNICDCFQTDNNDYIELSEAMKNLVQALKELG